MMTRKEIAVVGLLVVMLAAAWLGIRFISDAESGEETQLVRDAVKRAALTCYATEGAYPSDVEYLREYYALAYDEERYVVDYDAFASNVMPEIRVLEKGAR